MKKKYEVFLEFPTTEEIIKYQNYSITSGKNSYFKINQIFEDWGKNRIFFTLSKAKYKKAIRYINNETEKINILKNLCEEKDNGKDNEVSKNSHRECKLTEDLRFELIEILIFHGKLTEFIDNNGEVKDNPKEFDVFCVDILKEMFVNKFYCEELTEKEGEQIEVEMSKKIDINNDLHNKIKSFVVKKIRNSTEQYQQMFLFSYFKFNDMIDRNKDRSPSDVDGILKNKISSGTEKEIRRVLDPLDFWVDFEKEFKEEIKDNDYYKILYKLISKPEIEKKQDYISEKITRNQYKKMNTIEKKIFSFIDECKKELNNKINVKQQLQNDLQVLLNNIDENNKVLYENTREYYNLVSKSSNEELIDSLLEKIKPFFLRFTKNTRKTDIKLKKQALEMLEDQNLKACGNNIFNNDNIFSYAQNLLMEQEKDVIKKHLEICDKCKAFYYAIKQGLNYRKKRDKQIFYLLKNPYSVVKKYETEAEYLNNLTVEHYNKEFKQNPCDANFYYLILSYINNGNIYFAQKLLNEGKKVYKKDTAFIRQTIIDLKK